MGSFKNYRNYLKGLLLTASLIFSLPTESNAEVTEPDVIEYLTGYGYEVIKADPFRETDDWITDNKDGSHTLVEVENGIIVGHQDIDL